LDHPDVAADVVARSTIHVNVCPPTSFAQVDALNLGRSVDVLRLTFLTEVRERLQHLVVSEIRNLRRVPVQHHQIAYPKVSHLNLHTRPKCLFRSLLDFRLLPACRTWLRYYSHCTVPS